MKPRLIALISAAVGLAAALAAPAPAQAQDISTAEELLATKSGDVRLTDNIKINTAWHIKGDLSLDLNGHTIDRGLSEDQSRRKGSVLYLEKGSHLTLFDSGPKEDILDSTGRVVGHSYEGTITGGWGWYDGGGIACEKNCSISMHGGNITGNRTSENGGGIELVDGCSFAMFDGKISQNVSAKVGDWRSCGYGGGIYAKNADVYISGGLIADNSTDGKHGGGGICAKGSQVELAGGLIRGNRASCGAGIYFSSSSEELILTGTTIEQNVTNGGDGEGGGLFIEGDARLKGGLIHNNRATKGGGVAIYDSSRFYVDKKVQIGKVTIDGNEASAAGGGAYIYGAVVDIDGATVSGNKTSGTGGGIHIAGRGYPDGRGQVTLESGTITQNTASSGASAIYVDVDRASVLVLRGGHIVNNNPGASTKASCPAVSNSEKSRMVFDVDSKGASQSLLIVDNNGGNFLNSNGWSGWVASLAPDTRIGVSSALGLLDDSQTFMSVAKKDIEKTAQCFGCFFPDDPTMTIWYARSSREPGFSEGHYLNISTAGTVAGMGGVVTVTSAKVESYAESGEEPVSFEHAFVKDGQTDTAKTWSFVPSEYIDRKDAKVTLTYNLETVDGEGKTHVETRTQVFEHQDLSVPRLFMVKNDIKVKYRDDACGFSSCQIELLDPNIDYATTKVESIELDGAVKTVEGRRGLGSKAVLTTAAKLGDAAFSGWTMSLDDGATWTTFDDVESIQGDDGMITTNLMIPATVPSGVSIRLRPVYLLKGISLDLAAPLAGDELPTSANWASTATGANTGTATVAWSHKENGTDVPDTGAAKAGVAYRAAVTIDAGDYVMVAKNSKVAVSGLAGKTLRIKTAQLHASGLDVTFGKTADKLVKVISPDSVSVTEGTPLSKAGLPSTVKIETTGGEREAAVTWDASSYDVKVVGHCFVVGSVTMPEGVDAAGVDTRALIVVEVVADPNPTYSLKVQGGTGSGSYKAGAKVHVVAGSIDGQSFEKWNPQGIELTDAQRTSKAIEFSMPAANVTLEAVMVEDAPEVSSIDIEVAKPEAGKDLPTPAVVSADSGRERLLSASPNGGTTVPATWKANDKMVSGVADYDTDYNMVVVLGSAAVDGGAIAEDAEVTVNGEPAQAKYNMADGSLEVSRTFKTGLPKITADPVAPSARTLQTGAAAEGLDLPDTVVVETEDGPYEVHASWSMADGGDIPETFDAAGTYKLTGTLDLDGAGVEARGDKDKAVACEVTVQDAPVAAAPHVTGDARPGVYEDEAGSTLSVSLESDTPGAEVRYQVVEHGAEPDTDKWKPAGDAVALDYGAAGETCLVDVLAYAVAPEGSEMTDSPVTRFVYALDVPQVQREICVRGTNNFNAFSAYNAVYTVGDKVTLPAIPLEGSVFDHWECDTEGVIPASQRSSMTLVLDSAKLPDSDPGIRAVYRPAIDEVALTFDAPAAGTSLASSAKLTLLGLALSEDTDAHDATISWSPADGAAKAGAAYTATIRISGVGAYALEDVPTLNLTGTDGTPFSPDSWSAAIDGDDLVITASFAKLPEPAPTPDPTPDPDPTPEPTPAPKSNENGTSSKATGNTAASPKASTTAASAKALADTGDRTFAAVAALIVAGIAVIAVAFVIIRKNRSR